jgi:hypothetical protein
MAYPLSAEYKRIIVQFMLSLLVSLVVVGATNALYWQPQLDYLHQQLKESQLHISISPADGWTPVGTTACAVVHRDSAINVEITYNGRDTLQVLRAIITAPYGNITLDINQKLYPGDLLVVKYTPHNAAGLIIGERAQLTIALVTVELPLQTTSFCITST